MDPGRQPKTLRCVRCGASWPGTAEALRQMDRCPACGTRVQVVAFPALERAAVAGSAAQPAVMADEATCFFHPTHRAAVACEECGRFLCALCDLEVSGRHVCPGCLESAHRGGKMQELERQRTRYDHVVWALVLMPLASCGLLLPLTAPAAVGVALWKWHAPPSLVHRSRLRTALALPLAVLELPAGLYVWLNGFG